MHLSVTSFCTNLRTVTFIKKWKLPLPLTLGLSFLKARVAISPEQKEWGAAGTEAKVGEGLPVLFQRPHGCPAVSRREWERTVLGGPRMRKGPQ